MAQYEHAKKGIFVRVKPPMKPLAHPDSTPPNQDPLRALNAHPERMPILLVPKPAKIVILIPTNRNPMLLVVFQCKKGFTNRAQQLRSNVPRVKQEAVVIQVVKNATKEDFKPWRGTPPVWIVPVDCTPLLKVQSLAYLVHRVHMLRRMEQVIVIRVVMMNINPIRVLQIVFQCKKDFIVQDQQRKWNAQRVKEETVATQLAKNATKEDFKTWRVIPRV